jgi:branched-subunit amino acid ABC-type transport system permease component
VNNFWPFVIAGLTTGSLYGIAAMGLVLTYKTSGIFNFAHGAVAAGGAYIFFELNSRNDVPWPIAALIVIFVVAPIAGVLTERIARGLAGAPPAAKIVATVGLLLAVSGTATAIFGAAAINFPQFLPTRTYKFAGLFVGVDQMISVAIAALAAAGLYAFFRFSKLGVAMRGVVDNPDLLDLAGTSPARVRTQAWIIGNCFAALSGILLAPLTGLDAILLTLLVVQAFGAAAVGAFTSLPLTYLGGLVVGVGGALATKYVVDIPNLAGFPPSLPFIVLFAVLLLTPKGRFVEAGRRRLAKERTPMAPALQWGGRLAALAALVAVPQVVGTRLPVYSNALIFILIFLSLRLLVRTSGQVSLCHAAFAAMGAAAFAHLAHGAGLPWPVALLGAGLATVPIGAMVAIPAIRLSGLYLALATFGFGILVERMVFGTGLMFGARGARSAPRPGDFLGFDLNSDKGFYYVSLVVVVVVTVGMFWLNRSRLGKLCQAMADSPVALATHGANVNVTRVLVFCVSAFIAGIAGALFAALAGSISGIGFGPFSSLTWLTVLALAGVGEFSAAVIAAFVLAVVPSYVDKPAYTDWQPVIFGVLAVTASLTQGGGLPFAAWFRRSAERYAERGKFSPVKERMRLAGLNGQEGAVADGTALAEAGRAT